MSVLEGHPRPAPVAREVAPAATYASSFAVLAAVSRLHIIAIAALASVAFGWMFFGRWMASVGAIVALDWFLVNLLNRVVDLPEDRLNRIVGTDFVARRRGVLLWTGFTTLAVSIVAVHVVAPWLTPLRIAFHALGFAYNWRLLPPWGPVAARRRIKELYFWKNTASATGFLLTVFAAPLAIGYAQHLPLRISPIGVAVLVVFFTLFEISYEVLYDLRDVDGDRAAKVATYPVVHGPAAARRIVDVLVATSVLVLIAGYAGGVVPWRAAVMVAAPLTQTLYVRVRRARGDREVDARDCIRLTWLGAALFVVYGVWVSLGLPGV